MFAELRLAFRQLLRTSGVTITALVSLALGIAACTAVFSVVDQVLLRPPPYPDADRIVVVESSLLPDYPAFPTSPADYLDWAGRTTRFAELAATFDRSGRLTGAGQPARVVATRATGNFFDVYGESPVLGRTFDRSEDQAGKDGVVVLSHRLWVQQFGASPSVVGQILRIDGAPRTVIGVMPASFLAGGLADCWVPMAFSDFERSEDFRGARCLDVVGRLAPGATLAEARAELSGVAAQLQADHPGSNRGWTVAATTLREHQVGRLRPMLWLLFGAVGSVLLIVCVNNAILLLARGVHRVREMAIRTALGATRGRLTRQLLAESALLAVAGGVLGTLAAWWSLDVLQALAPAALHLPALTIDGRVLGFSCALTLLTGIGFGVAPAWQLSSVHVSESLKDGGRGGADHSRKETLRRVLVSLEIALSLALCACAGLLARSLGKLSQVSLGFETRNALAMTVDLPQNPYADDASKVAFTRQALERISALPAVHSAGVTQSLPMQGRWLTTFEEMGNPTSRADERKAIYYAVTPGYFPAMGIRLVKGRLFSETDNEKASPVALVSEAFVRQYFPNGDAIGRRIWIKNCDVKYREIVGVVADVRPDGVAGAFSAQMYEPFWQAPNNALHFVVRTVPGAAGVPAALREKLRGVDPEQPVTSIRPLEAIVRDTIARQRFAALLLSVFSFAAVVIAVAGVYGVMSYSAARRTSEIGLRVALGATRMNILLLVLRQGAAVVGAGVGAGVLAALFATGLLQSLLFDTSPRDPLTLGLTAAVFSAVTLLACFIPALSASRVDPNVALRTD